MKLNFIIVKSIFITLLFSGCGGSKDDDPAEIQKRADFSEKSALICANKIATTLNLVDPKTKKMLDYSVCPIDLMSDNVICPSASGGINFITSLPFEIPNNPTKRYPSIKFAMVHNGQDLRFYCWLENGYPIHIVHPNGQGKQGLIDGDVVFSMVQ